MINHPRFSIRLSSYRETSSFTAGQEIHFTSWMTKFITVLPCYRVTVLACYRVTLLPCYLVTVLPCKQEPTNCFYPKPDQSIGDHLAYYYKIH